VVFIDRARGCSEVSGVLHADIDPEIITIDLYSLEAPTSAHKTVILTETHEGELKYEFSKVCVFWLE